MTTVFRGMAVAAESAYKKRRRDGDHPHVHGHVADEAGAAGHERRAEPGDREHQAAGGKHRRAHQRQVSTKAAAIAT
jgi:hypothetical protein